MVVLRSRLVSAVTSMRIMITKAQKFSSFRAHTDPQGDLSLAGITPL